MNTVVAGLLWFSAVGCGLLGGLYFAFSALIMTSLGRIDRAAGIAAVYLNAGSSLLYFTGMRWHASERMVGAVLPAEGEIEFIAPKFQEGTVHDYMVVPGKVNCWEEHEAPTALFVSMLDRMCPGDTTARVGIEKNSPS